MHAVGSLMLTVTVDPPAHFSVTDLMLKPASRQQSQIVSCHGAIIRIFVNDWQVPRQPLASMIRSVHFGWETFRLMLSSSHVTCIDCHSDTGKPGRKKLTKTMKKTSSAIGFILTQLKRGEQERMNVRRTRLHVGSQSTLCL